MAAQRTSSPFAGLALLAVGLMLSGCTGTSMPSFPSFGSTPEQAPPPPSGSEAAIQSRYTPEELVGRWGFTSYHRDQDRARTEAAARGQCKNPYVIARGPQGGIMMHLADQRQPTELRLKGSASGKQYTVRAVRPAWPRTARSCRSTAASWSRASSIRMRATATAT